MFLDGSHDSETDLRLIQGKYIPIKTDTLINLK